MSKNNLKEKVYEKDWWTAVWQGLAVDQEGKHLKNMGMAIWLFLYFLLFAERSKGILKRRYETIARDMGQPVGKIRRWLSVLKKHGYITAAFIGYAQVIHIKKFKPYLPRKTDQI